MFNILKKRKKKQFNLIQTNNRPTHTYIMEEA